MPAPGRKISIDIAIHADAWSTAGFDAAAVTRRALEATLAHAPLPENCGSADIEIAVALSDDDEMHALNRQYRGMDKPTNVLSFATLDDPGHKPPAAGEAFFLGDIIMSFETLHREAAAQNKDLQDHFSHLAVHGTLHLLGYDHQTEAEADGMEALEINILETIGVKNPYLTGHSMA